MKAVFSAYDRHAHRLVEEYRYCPRCATPLTQREVGGKQRPVCVACGFVRFRNPAPGVAVLLVDDQRVLLGKRRGEPGAGKWALVSGYIEFSADFVTTAVEEVKTETGLDVVLEAIVHVESAFITPQYHFFSAYLLARPVGGSLHPGDDLCDARWFDVSETLPEMAFQSDCSLIAAYAAGTLPRMPIGT